MNKQQLASKIWESADKMRSKIPASKYKDYILGFIFYKFLSDKEVKYLKEIGYTDENINTVTEDDNAIKRDVQSNLGYFISYENLFSTWLALGHDFNIGNVTDALSAFGRLINPTHRKVFSDIFDTLATGLTEFGNTAETRTKAIRDLIYLINDIPMDGRQDYDVLGFVYEYLLSNFAANAGKAGEFYTPHEASSLMAEIISNHLKNSGLNKIDIYDPTSGSGSLLINIGMTIKKIMGLENGIKYYAQELIPDSYNLTRMNLVMHNILPDNIVVRRGDTLERDWPWFEENDPVGTYQPLYVDAVMSNPPYSQGWTPQESDPRFSYGLAPKSKAEYAFLLHSLYHLKPQGIMTIVLPHGVLFRDEEADIRKNLIENNKIDTIIGLPGNMFFGTSISTIIMVLKKNRENTDVLFIDASKGFIKAGKKNKLRASNVKKIVDAVVERKSVEKFSNVVSLEEIRENKYNLNIPRYVDSSEPPESWDIYATMFGGIPATELNMLGAYWDVFPNVRNALFKDNGKAYLHLNVENIKKTVTEHSDISKFTKKFEKAFSNFSPFLEKTLINCDQNQINIASTENIISENIRERFKGIPLVDFYDAYQILDDQWHQIANDLEIIQTEGQDSFKKVDPNMVIKKRNGGDTEVQDGYIGRVFPFDIVQKRFFSNELVELQGIEMKLSEITANYETLLEELPEDDRERDFVNEDKTAFVVDNVKKAIKDNNVEPEVLAVLEKFICLNKEEKKLKKEIKTKSADLHLKSKNKIESLSDKEIKILLKDKWINPLILELKGLPENVIRRLVLKLETLSKKYETTFSDVEKEIKETEKSLSFMMGELTGNANDIKGIQKLKELLGDE